MIPKKGKEIGYFLNVKRLLVQSFFLLVHQKSTFKRKKDCTKSRFTLRKSWLEILWILLTSRIKRSEEKRGNKRNHEIKKSLYIYIYEHAAHLLWPCIVILPKLRSFLVSLLRDVCKIFFMRTPQRLV